MLCTDKRGSSWRIATVEKLLVRKSIIHKVDLIFASFLSNCFSQPAVETQKPLEIAEPMTHISLKWTAFSQALFHVKHARK